MSEMDKVYGLIKDMEQTLKDDPILERMFRLLCEVRADVEDVADFLIKQNGGIKDKIIHRLLRGAIDLGVVQNYMLDNLRVSDK